MQSHLIKENVDIYQHPTRDSENQIYEGTQLTIGDLHANAIKFLYFLIRHNVLDIPKDQYAELVKIYNTRQHNQKLRILKMSNLDFNECYRHVMSAFKSLDPFNNFAREIAVEEGEYVLAVKKATRKFNAFLFNLKVLIAVLEFQVSILKHEVFEEIKTDLQKFHHFLLDDPSFFDDRDKNDSNQIIANLKKINKLDLNASKKKAREIIESELRRFNEIIAEAKVNETKPEVIRLIGDELSDRGSNDYFILKILEKLDTSKIPIEIMLSNHGMEFVGIYEEWGLENAEIDISDIEEDSSSYPSNIGYGQDRSIQNLGILINGGLVSTNEIKDIVEKYYKPNLKLFSYTIDESTNTIATYRHGYVGLETIKSLSKTKQFTVNFDVKYNDRTIKNLAETIDEINEVFKIYYVLAGCIYSLINMTDSEKCRINPIYHLIWGRSGELIIDMPAKRNGYNHLHVHGHDGAGFVPKIYQKYVINLDNTLGKSEFNRAGEWVEGNIGEYTILISQMRSPSLIEQKTQNVYTTGDSASPTLFASSTSSAVATEATLFHEFEKTLLKNIVRAIGTDPEDTIADIDQYGSDIDWTSKLLDAYLQTPSVDTQKEEQIKICVENTLNDERFKDIELHELTKFLEKYRYLKPAVESAVNQGNPSKF